MRQTDSRKVAVAGVVVAAVLASSSVTPTVGHLSTLDGAWPAALIMGVPTAAVLVVTWFRHFGPGRSIVVAAGIMAAGAKTTAPTSGAPRDRRRGPKPTGARLLAACLDSVALCG